MIPKFSFLLLLLLFGFQNFAQIVRVDTLILNKSEKVENSSSFRMNWPKIRTGDSNVDSLINHDLKNKFTRHEYKNVSVDSALTSWSDDQLVFLDFEITYNQNSIVSLSISAEGCAAYCSYWTKYYSYSVKTGQPLILSDILEMESGFKELVFLEKNKQFEQQKRELKDMLTDSDIDQNAYEWAIGYYNECENNFEMNEFSIQGDGIKIIQDCYLPHAIQNLTPIINLTYNFTELREYLKF